MVVATGDQARGVRTHSPQYDAARHIQFARDLKGAGRESNHPAHAVPGGVPGRVECALDGNARVARSVAEGGGFDGRRRIDVPRNPAGNTRIPFGHPRGRKLVECAVRSATAAGAGHDDLGGGVHRRIDHGPRNHMEGSGCRGSLVQARRVDRSSFGLQDGPVHGGVGRPNDGCGHHSGRSRSHFGTAGNDIDQDFLRPARQTCAEKTSESCDYRENLTRATASWQPQCGRVFDDRMV